MVVESQGLCWASARSLSSAVWTDVVWEATVGGGVGPVWGGEEAGSGRRSWRDSG